MTLQRFSFQRKTVVAVMPVVVMAMVVMVVMVVMARVQILPRRKVHPPRWMWKGELLEQEEKGWRAQDKTMRMCQLPLA